MTEADFCQEADEWDTGVMAVDRLFKIQKIYCESEFKKHNLIFGTLLKQCQFLIFFIKHVWVQYNYTSVQCKHIFCLQKCVASCGTILYNSFKSTINSLLPLFVSWVAVSSPKTQ